MLSALFRQMAFEHEMFVPTFGADDPMPVIVCDESRIGAEGIVIFLSTDT